jgi:hypothetical protein
MHEDAYIYGYMLKASGDAQWTTAAPVRKPVAYAQKSEEEDHSVPLKYRRPVVPKAKKPANVDPKGGDIKSTYPYSAMSEDKEGSSGYVRRRGASEAADEIAAEGGMTGALMKTPYISDFSQAIANKAVDAKSAYDLYKDPSKMTQDPRFRIRAADTLRKGDMSGADAGFYAEALGPQMFQPGGNTAALANNERFRKAMSPVVDRAVKNPDVRKAGWDYVKKNYGKQLAGAGALGLAAVGIPAMMAMRGRRQSPAQSAMAQAFQQRNSTVPGAQAKTEPYAMRFNEQRSRYNSPNTGV